MKTPEQWRNLSKVNNKDTGMTPCSILAMETPGQYAIFVKVTRTMFPFKSTMETPEQYVKYVQS